MKVLGKRDMILAAAILLIAAAVFGFNYVSHRTPAATAQISVDGKVVEILDLSKDTELTVTGPGGGTNHLIVKDGEIWCSEASCPDKVCVHQGKKHLSSDTIVCLPNKIVVTITGIQQNAAESSKHIPEFHIPIFFGTFLQFPALGIC